MRFFRKLIVAGLLQVFWLSQVDAQTTVQVTGFPQDLQLYQRGANNLALVSITGSAPPVYKQVSLKILRNTALYFYQKLLFPASDAPASFTFSPSIHAEATEYDFSLYAHTSATDSTLVGHSQRIVCGDALILYGQSNVLALNDLDNYVVDDRLLRNFTYPFQSTDIPDQVAWSTAKVPFGTVGGIGLWVQKLILDNFGIPTCVMDGGVGGTPISTLSLRNLANHAILDTYYGLLLYRAQRSGLADKARIVVYKQGEADAALNSDHYGDALRKLTDQFEEDYPAVKKIYVSQLNILADPMPRGGEVREAQRRAKQQAPLIETIATVGTPTYDGVHYLKSGNQQIATELYRQIARDFYGAKDTLQINSPNIKTAVYNARQDTITLTFDDQMRMVWPKDTTYYNYAKGTQYSRRMIDFMYLDGVAGVIISGFARRNQIILALKQPSKASTITYLPSFFSDANNPFYDGVHLKNERGMRAFSFDKFLITTLGAPKLAQSISTSIINSTTFGDAPVTLTAVASSGLPVTFQIISGPALLINSHQARLTGIGSISIKTTQAGDEHYLPATAVLNTLTVSKGSQTIGNLIQSARPGQTALVVSATASSGLPLNYSLVQGPATLSGTTLTISDWGQATLKLSQPGDSRYLPAPDLIQTLCLNPLKPTISTDPTSDLILVSSSPFRNQWFLNSDTIRTGTKQKLTVDRSGSYLVKVKNPAAACNDTEQSLARQIIILGTEPALKPFQLLVYPNPASDQIRVRLPSLSIIPTSLQLVDERGRSLFNSLTLQPTSDGYETTLSVRSLASGIYMLRATTEQGPIVARILIHH